MRVDIAFYIHRSGGSVERDPPCAWFAATVAA